VQMYTTKHFSEFLDVFGCWEFDASGVKLEVIAFPG